MSALPHVLVWSCAVVWRVVWPLVVDPSVSLRSRRPLHRHQASTKLGDSLGSTQCTADDQMYVVFWAHHVLVCFYPCAGTQPSLAGPRSFNMAAVHASRLPHPCDAVGSLVLVVDPAGHVGHDQQRRASLPCLGGLRGARPWLLRFQGGPPASHWRRHASGVRRVPCLLVEQVPWHRRCFCGTFPPQPTPPHHPVCVCVRQAPRFSVAAAPRVPGPGQYEAGPSLIKRSFNMVIVEEEERGLRR